MPSISTSPADHLPEMGAPVAHGSLKSGAEVHRDAWGIPHIRSDELYDLFFAQGFATAQDRLWQMDYDRMRCLGRAGEYVGVPAKTQDFLMRRRNFERVSRADYSICSPDAKTALDAYAAGVNAFITGKDPLPFEYALLETEPEHWEPWHCLAVYKVRNSAEGGFHNKLWQATLTQRIGAERAAKFMTGYHAGMYLTVPPGIQYDGEAADAVDELHAVLAACEPLKELDLGSNGWAISGDLTTTGLPMVGGDSHRGLEMPNVYYQTHLTHPDFDVIGHAIPGMPFVMHFAHNRHVAWGMTHGGCDTQDLYVEQLRRIDGGVQYLFKDEWLEAEVTKQSFRFIGDAEGSGEIEEVAEVVKTHHGPVITGGPESGWGISLADPGSEDATPWVDATLAVMKCRNADEFEAALAGWTDRVNNYPYADVYGEFGYCLKGRVPMRTFVNAFGPVPGWTGKHEWQGYIPPHQMPRVRNPKTGWVVTCNQRVVGDDYPFWLAASFGPDYRARRIISHIERHIKEGREITLEDMRDFHADTVSITGLQFKAWLETLIESDPDDFAPREAKFGVQPLSKAAELILNWDGSMKRDSEAALVYADVSDLLALEIMSNLYEIDKDSLEANPGLLACAYDHYRRNIRPAFMTKLQHASDAHRNIWGLNPSDLTKDVLTGAMERRRSRKEACWLEGAVGEEDDQFADWELVCSMPEDYEAYIADDGPRTWDEVHLAAQDHPFRRHRVGRFKAHWDELSAPDVATAGYEDVPLATSGNCGLSKNASSGPVNRYLHDPSDWRNGRWIVPLGASGNSASPHVTDQQHLWADVEYVPQLYDWDDIARSRESLQRFSPLD